MRISRRLSALAVLAACLLAPTGAQAQDPASGMTLDLGRATTDLQGTHVAVPATCTAADPGQPACVVTVLVSSQRTPVGKFAPSGPKTALAQTTATIPMGTTQTVGVDIAPAKLRDPLMKARGAAVVSFAFLDDGVDVGGSSVYVSPPPRLRGCGAPGHVPIVSGALDENEQHGFTATPLWQPLHSPDIIAGTQLRVTSPSAVLRFDGVTWTFAKGSVLSLTCTGLTDYFKGRAFPTFALDRGSVHAVGTPRGGLRAVTVVTAEGNLGMRRAEPTSLTVTQDAARLVSTMHVTRGTSGQITTLYKGSHDGVHSSPCTNGRSLSVNRYGVIKPA